MSYTFSRRNFMKYTALAAAAVAVSGSLTACSNPNQPSGVYNGSDVTLSFGGSSGILGIGGSTDKQILKAQSEYGATKTSYSNGTLTCVFQHEPVSDGTSTAASHYQLRVVNADKTIEFKTAANATFTASNGGVLKSGDKIENILTISGVDLSDAEELYIQYYPRNTALGDEKDSYSDVYATWTITSLLG